MPSWHQSFLMIAFVHDRGWVDYFDKPKVYITQAEEKGLLEYHLVQALTVTRKALLAPDVVLAPDDDFASFSKNFLSLDQGLAVAEDRLQQAREQWKVDQIEKIFTERATKMRMRLEKGLIPRQTYLGYAGTVYAPFVFLLVRVPQYMWLRMNPTRAE